MSGADGLYVDNAFDQAVRFMDLGIHAAVRIRLRDLGQLLDTLREKMGRAFESEIGRLNNRVDQLTENGATRRGMREWLEARASPSALS